MALLKQIRLQQVQHVLRHREQRQILACDTVHEGPTTSVFTAAIISPVITAICSEKLPRQTLARSAA